MVQAGNTGAEVSPIIEVRDLKVKLAHGTAASWVLDIPHWNVHPGEQAALFGRSGCGKSTLLHVLSGVLMPTSGSVRVCGTDLTTLDEAKRDAFRAHKIGYVFQNLNLLPGYTALENVLLGASFSGRVDRAKAVSLLKAMDLADRLNQPPNALSLGEQQRVAVARALVKEPELVLADEPTASLDPRNSARVIDLLQAACRGCGSTLVLVTHEPEVLTRFERQVPFRDLNRPGEEVERRR